MKVLETLLLEYSDSSFTNPHEVISPQKPFDRQGHFSHMGAQFWGFETARHIGTRIDNARSGFHYNPDAEHYLLLGLKQSGVISQIDISTRWFTGNHVQAVTIELIYQGRRRTIVERKSLNPDANHSFPIEPSAADECLIRCHQEGGIASIQLMGEDLGEPDTRINLLSEATISQVSNQHYGHPGDAVKGERFESHMVGWESARTGFGEQAMFALKSTAVVDEVIIDTYLHRLNAPLGCYLFGLPSSEDFQKAVSLLPKWRITFDDGSQIIPENFQDYMSKQLYRPKLKEKSTGFHIDLSVDSSCWLALIPFGELRPDTYHRFSISANVGLSHLLYLHYPNGGIHGIKAFGSYLK